MTKSVGFGTKSKKHGFVSKKCRFKVIFAIYTFCIMRAMWPFKWAISYGPYHIDHTWMDLYRWHHINHIICSILYDFKLQKLILSPQMRQCHLLLLCIAMENLNSEFGKKFFVIFKCEIVGKGYLKFWLYFLVYYVVYNIKFIFRTKISSLHPWKWLE